MNAPRFACFCVLFGDYFAPGGRFTKDPKKAALHPKATWDSWFERKVRPSGYELIGRDFTEEDEPEAFHFIPEDEL